jgi:hypothetical protein
MMCNYLNEGCDGGWSFFHGFLAENGYMVSEKVLNSGRKVAKHLFKLILRYNNGTKTTKHLMRSQMIRYQNRLT